MNLKAICKICGQEKEKVKVGKVWIDEHGESWSGRVCKPCKRKQTIAFYERKKEIDPYVFQTYRIWQTMRKRCSNPRASGYEYYGGRGITVCERWSAFDLFLKDMGPRPTGKSIDRIDSNKGYFPENCRWSTTKEQNRNLRTNKIVSFNGKSLCISAWAEQLLMKPNTLAKRLLAGWSIEKALTTPIKGKPVK